MKRKRENIIMNKINYHCMSFDIFFNTSDDVIIILYTFLSIRLNNIIFYNKLNQ